jgi:hypothetical protein
MVSVGCMAVRFLFIDVCIFINISMFLWADDGLNSAFMAQSVQSLDYRMKVLFPAGVKSFLFSVESGVALGHTQPRIQHIPRALSRATQNQECVETYLPFPIQFYNLDVN